MASAQHETQCIAMCAVVTDFVHKHSTFFKENLLRLEQLLAICRALFYEHNEMPISAHALAACVTTARTMAPHLERDYVTYHANFVWISSPHTAAQLIVVPRTIARVSGNTPPA